MAHEMDVPTDDLSVYHARIFGYAAPAQSLPYDSNPETCAVKRSWDEGPGQEDNFADWEDGGGQHGYFSTNGESGRVEVDGTKEEAGEDDELGYYPDGVKRTLTDEQVAMFRHSEIYALQRARQVAMENREADDEGEGRGANEMDEEEDTTGKKCREIPYGLKMHSSPPTAIALFPQDFTEPENDTEENSTLAYKPNIVDPGSKMDQKQMQLALKRPSHKHMASQRDEKRKGRRQNERNDDNDDDVDNKIRSRGRVRQLDAAFTEEQVLDYGGSRDFETDAAQQPKPEGKKIWWPVLGE